MQYLDRVGYIDRELDEWYHERNRQYVVDVEVALSKLVGPDGDDVSDGTPPPHFYGELVKTQEGRFILEDKGHFAEFVDFVRAHGLEDRDQATIDQLKSVLWAIGHVGSTVHGLPLLEDEGVIELLMDIAISSNCLSVRGCVDVACSRADRRRTCYYVIALLAKTQEGAEILEDFDWDVTYTALRIPLALALPRNVNAFLRVRLALFRAPRLTAADPRLDVHAADGCSHGRLPSADAQARRRGH